MKKIFSIIKKEFYSFFSSPLGYVFLASYVFACLFCFFWVEKFFERNILDLRPLFIWNPLLLIFLSGCLTMRAFSEEKKLGTIELILSHPIKNFQLVMGKFLACLLLLSIGILLTIFIPISVSFMGDFDWGTAIGAYFACFFLAGTYVALGLFISSKTDNQILSLIFTILSGGLLFFIGNNLFAQFFNSNISNILYKLGTGARFESVARGVLSISDIYYYFSLLISFLIMTSYQLTKTAWAKNNSREHKKIYFYYLFIILNILVANIWIDKVNLKVDLTEKKEYTVSKTTKKLLKQIQEPLIIKAFFSQRTHPQLSPLVNHIKDLLNEYSSYNPKIKLEFVDPKQNPELEEQANKKFGIKPIPFQIADRHESSIVNSYFDIALSYGDRFEVLGFNKLIDVRFDKNQIPEVRLKSLEYDLSKTIKKLIYEFNTIESIVEKINSPVQLKIYSSNQLPEQIKRYSDQLVKVYNQYSNLNKNLSIEIIDPSLGNTAEVLAEQYGIYPMVSDLEQKNKFYFYPLFFANNEVYSVPNPTSWDEDGAKKSLEAIFKRISPGLTKNLAVLMKKPDEQQQVVQTRTFNYFLQNLQKNYNLLFVEDKIPAEADFLMILGIEEISDSLLFSIDQFLMRGGTLLISTAPFAIKRDVLGMSVENIKVNLIDWLKHHNIEIGNDLVMDKQSEKFPIQIRTQNGEKELALIDYPPILDIRNNDINQSLLGISEFGYAWGTNIVSKSNLKTTSLLKSSNQAWLSKDRSLEPKVINNTVAFQIPDHFSQYDLGMMFEGKFKSYFADKTPEGITDINSYIKMSNENARIILFSSNDLFSDLVFSVNSELGTNRFENTILGVENIINYSLEDDSLKGISRTGHFARTINPKYISKSLYYEIINYILAAFGLFFVYIIVTIMSKMRENYYRNMIRSIHE